MSQSSSAQQQEHILIPRGTPVAHGDGAGDEDWSTIADEVSLGSSYRHAAFAPGTHRTAFLPSTPGSLTNPLNDECERLLLVDDAWPRRMEVERKTGSDEVRAGASDERTALLGADGREGGRLESGEPAPRTTSGNEARLLLKNSLPLYITFLLQYSLTLSSIFSAGNLGKDELAGVSLGAMTAVITAYAPYQGFATALDTLCGQAYGAGNKALVGLHTQRMVMFLMVVTIPITALWLFSEPLLALIIPDPGLVKFTAIYLRILVFGAPGYAMFEAGKRFVQAQGLFASTTYVLLICAPLNAFLNYFLVWNPTFGMGYTGAPTAVVLTNWLMPLLLFLYVRFVAGAECWTGFSRRALTNWIPMIKLAIPGFVMLEAEYLAFEILTLAASYFSTAHVAAQSILSTTLALAFQLGFAVAIATSTRTANLLGAGMGAAAKITARVGLAIATVIGVLNLLLIIAVRKQYVRWFTDDQEVIELFMGAIWVGATFQLVDALGVTTAGVLRGQGRQKIGSYINLTAYYVIGLPLSFVLGFLCHLELVGLWAGVAVGLLFIAVAEVALIYFSDWDQVVSDAKERLQNDAGAH